jgi:predicted nucleic acid-binding protein
VDTKDGAVHPDPDIPIGATALQYGLTVVTRNLHHFERIPSLAIYT